MIKCNLAVLMAERGVNIQNVADATGMSRTTISALVNENGKGIQFETMNGICEYLEVTPGQLFTHVLVSHDIKLLYFEDIIISKDDTLALNSVKINISCNVKLNLIVIQDSLKYEKSLTFHLKIIVINGSIDSFSYELLNPAELHEYFQKVAYFVKEFTEAEIEVILVDEASKYFEEITTSNQIHCFERIM